MPFKDDNLKQLKDLLDDPQASGFFTEEMARGILARLETAEVVCEHVGRGGPYQAFISLEAWRKAAGK